MLGSANVFNSIGLDPVLKQMGGNGTLIAVRAVDASHVVLFLEFKPEQRDTESKSEEQKPAKLTLAVIDLSNWSAVSWESTEDVVRVTEIDDAKFLLEYVDSQYAEAQCGPDAVSIQNLSAKTTIDFAVDTLWCLRLPANRYERTLTTMELPISEANAFNIRVEGGAIDKLILQHDRICAQRDGKQVGRWFAPGSYSLLDFNATQGRIFVRGESQRLQVVELATKKQDASEDLQDVLAEIPERASYFMQLGRPDIARNILMGILFSRPNLTNLSRASLLMAEIQCRSGLFEQAVSILQTLIEDLAQGGEMDEDVRMFVQKELNVLSARAGFSRLQSDEKKSFFDNLIAMVPDFNVFVAILAEALEGGLVVDKIGRSIGESMLNEIRRRTPDTIELASVNSKALQFLDTLLARITNAERTATDEDIDWHAEVPKYLHSVLDQALGGSADSQLELGTKFGLGEGVKRNPLRALFWYQKAAAQGSAKAALNISQMYRHGEGVPRDLETAVMYLRFAAKAGNTFAKTNLAMMLLQGEGCERDVAVARELLIEAHNEGDDLATINLASVEAFGFGLQPNQSQAIELLTPLVRRGNARAMAVLSVVLKSNG
jgi:Sel1 repeat